MVNRLWPVKPAPPIQLPHAPLEGSGSLRHAAIAASVEVPASSNAWLSRAVTSLVTGALAAPSMYASVVLVPWTVAPFIYWSAPIFSFAAARYLVHDVVLKTPRADGARGEGNANRLLNTQLATTAVCGCLASAAFVMGLVAMPLVGYAGLGAACLGAGLGWVIESVRTAPAVVPTVPESLETVALSVADSQPLQNMTRDDFKQLVAQWALLERPLPGKSLDCACQRICDNFASKSENLDLRDCGLTSIPECLAHMPWLRQIDCRDNEIDDWPQIRNLFSGLKRLDLRDNLSCGMSEGYLLECLPTEPNATERHSLGSEGRWENGVLQGRVRITKTGGDIQVGSYARNERHGAFYDVHGDTYSIAQIYEHGKVVKWLRTSQPTQAAAA